MTRWLVPLILSLLLSASVAAQLYTLRLEYKEYTASMDDVMTALGLGAVLADNPSYRLEGNLLVVTIEVTP
jgi:hypothetical protein